jgi:hypothetical protein
MDGEDLLITTQLRATGEFAEPVELKHMELEEGHSSCSGALGFSPKTNPWKLRGR